MATKLTAANSVFLKNVKRDFNAKIYAKALALANEQSIEAARQYVQTFTTRPLGY